MGAEKLPVFFRMPTGFVRRKGTSQMNIEQRNLQITILRREGGTWDIKEFVKLGSIRTEISKKPPYPEHILLLGHHEENTILRALGIKEKNFTITHVEADSKDLPYKPHFI